MIDSSQNKIEIFTTEDNKINVEVKFDEDTVWLNQTQIQELFQKSKATVSEHIKNIYQEKELMMNSTVRNFRTVQIEGNRQVERNIEYYNLDVIISVGYRVKSQRGTQFRQWATQRLKDYLVTGYALNQKRFVISVLNRSFEVV